ncbi:hypothetical protein DXG01_004805, partial [Tephrocybe rancida]
VSAYDTHLYQEEFSLYRLLEAKQRLFNIEVAPQTVVKNTKPLMVLDHLFSLDGFDLSNFQSIVDKALGQDDLFIAKAEVEHSEQLYIHACLLRATSEVEYLRAEISTFPCYTTVEDCVQHQILVEQESEKLVGGSNATSEPYKPDLTSNTTSESFEDMFLHFMSNYEKPQSKSDTQKYGVMDEDVRVAALFGNHTK